jgi:hypothetical protein
MDATIHIGDRVRYRSSHTDSLCSGIVAELAVSPLTRRQIARVVDCHAKCKDPSAGLWRLVEELTVEPIKPQYDPLTVEV